MHITPEVEAIIRKIAHLYEDPERARNFLEARIGSDKWIEDESTMADLQLLLDAEEAVYDRRVQNGIWRKIELLEIALDETPCRCCGVIQRLPSSKRKAMIEKRQPLLHEVARYEGLPLEEDEGLVEEVV